MANSLATTVKHSHTHSPVHANELHQAPAGIFYLTFLALFVFALLATLVGAQWRTILPGAENAKGYVDGVRSAVYTFMSYIV